MTITPKELSEADQAFKVMAETLPAHFWSFYCGCKAEGFDEAQAMLLLLKHMEVLRKP